MATYPTERIELKNGRIVTLEPCVPRDAHLLQRFMEQIARETTHTLQYVGRPFPSPERVATRWADALRSPGDLFLGVYSADADSPRRMVAQLGFEQESPGHPWVSHIGDFGIKVLQEYWGLGIARRLIAAMEEHAARAGILRIEAKVRVSNERAWELYKSCGYILEGTRRYAARIGDRFEDEYYIAKILKRD